MEFYVINSDSCDWWKLSVLWLVERGTTSKLTNHSCQNWLHKTAVALLNTEFIKNESYKSFLKFNVKSNLPVALSLFIYLYSLMHRNNSSVTLTLVKPSTNNTFVKKGWFNYVLITCFGKVFFLCFVSQEKLSPENITSTHDF